MAPVCFRKNILHLLLNKYPCFKFEQHSMGKISLIEFYLLLTMCYVTP